MSLAGKSLANAAQLHQTGRLREAEEVYKFALSQAASAPDRARILHYLAIAVGQQGRQDEAIARLREAVEADPQQTGFREELGLMFARFGRHEEAMNAFREAIRVRPSANNARIHLGNELVSHRRIDEAGEIFQEAVEREPRNPMVLHALGFLAERMGDLAQARAFAERALQARQGHVESLILLARVLRRQGELATSRAVLERILQTGGAGGGAGPGGGLSAREGGRAAVELGFVLDAMGDHATAFQAFGAGKQNLFSLLSARQRDKNLATLTLDRCRRVVSAERVNAWRPPPKDDLPAPAFLVGYPRSGTTLLEQMLGAHPNIVVTGEDPILYRVKAAIPSMIGEDKPYPEALDDLAPEQLSRCRAMFWEEARKAFPSLGGKRLVEKHPLVIIDLPLVRRLFPEAHVLVLLRDPRDACLSCFMQDFDRGTPHFYSLDWTAEHFDLTMDLWLHYKEALPGLRHLQVRYEDLCGAPEKWARATLEFLGEPWNDAVMKYFEPAHRRYVTTPSYADVMQPVYSRSIGRWRNYEAQFTPLLNHLQRYIDAFGYGGARDGDGGASTGA